jgi:uncharacterized protein YjbJ (UPF0337 family)
MNRDLLEGSWRQIKGLLREKWGQLTSDQDTVVEGREEQLVGALQRRYAAQRLLTGTTSAGVLTPSGGVQHPAGRVGPSGLIPGGEPP